MTVHQQGSNPSHRQVTLDALHRRARAKMTLFAGYDMPLNYPSGIIAEHLHVRSAAGLFDVSHMGQLTIRSKSGGTEAVAAALERLMPMDFLSLGEGRQRYGLLTDNAGGILDDLMVARLANCFYLVVNASRKADDEYYLRATLGDEFEIEPLDNRALLALQGPLSASVLSKIFPGASDMDFMTVRQFELSGQRMIVSRSGYTGEDGYEISAPSAMAESFVNELLSNSSVKLSGLGARDSLRLEAGLCLYGVDIDEKTTPVEARLEWSIQKSRRRTGARAGGFPGAAEILGQLDHAPLRRRVGLKVEGRVPIRSGCELFSDASGDRRCGRVTSGCFGPSVNGPVAMGYVTYDEHEGGVIYAEQRGKRIATTIVPLPFVQPNYKRKTK